MAQQARLLGRWIFCTLCPCCAEESINAGYTYQSPPEGSVIKVFDTTRPSVPVRLLRSFTLGYGRPSVGRTVRNVTVTLRTERNGTYGKGKNVNVTFGPGTGPVPFPVPTVRGTVVGLGSGFTVSP